MEIGHGLFSSRTRKDTLRQMSEGDRSPLNRVEPRITSSLRWSYPFSFWGDMVYREDLRFSGCRYKE